MVRKHNKRSDLAEMEKPFQRLKVDELILPFMNGELLDDRPTQYASATVIKDKIGNMSYQVELLENSTWEDIFSAIDKLLIRSGVTVRVDLVGLVLVENVLKPIWA